MVDKVVRADVGDVAAGQPLTWTFIEFRVEVADIDRWIETLSAVLDECGGWYCDFRSADETFVVFAGQAFRYPRSDVAGRTEAADDARSVAVPEAQIDWPEQRCMCRYIARRGCASKAPDRRQWTAVRGSIETADGGRVAVRFLVELRLCNDALVRSVGIVMPQREFPASERQANK